VLVVAAGLVFRRSFGPGFRVLVVAGPRSVTAVVVMMVIVTMLVIAAGLVS